MSALFHPVNLVDATYGTVEVEVDVDIKGWYMWWGKVDESQWTCVVWWTLGLSWKILVLNLVIVC